jgi:predicted permease
LGIIVNAVFPLFALILLGYVSGRRRLLGPGAVDSLNKFVVWMALPALLFQSMAQITWEEVNQPGYLAATALAIAVVFALSWLLERRRRGRLADLSIEALAASYANAGFMGIPLCLMLFGEEGLPAVVLATLLTACGLFAFSIVLIEIDLQGSSRLGRTLSRVARSLLRNPLVTAPLLGMAVAALGWPLPYALKQFTSLLGDAASPCALVTIGLFLSQGRSSEHKGVVWRIVALKLVLHPAVAADVGRHCRAARRAAGGHRSFHACPALRARACGDIAGHTAVDHPVAGQCIRAGGLAGAGLTRAASRLQVDLVHEQRQRDIALGNAFRIVGGQRHIDAIVDIAPVGVMVQLFSLHRHTGHEAEGLVEILENEGLVNRVAPFDCRPPFQQ